MTTVLALTLHACTAAEEPSVGSESSAPTDQFVDVGGARIHVLDWGGEGDLVLMVPGLTATAYVYAGVAPALTDSYRVVAMTRRAHGLSDGLDGSPPSLDALADDIAAVIEHFSTDPAIVVGHSYAGVEIPRLAARHPGLIQAVVFLDAVYDWPGWSEEAPRLPGFSDGAESYPSIRSAQDWYASQFPEFDSEVTREYVRSQLQESPGRVTWRVPVPGEVATSFLEAYAEWSGAEYEALQVPVLSIRSAQEKFMAANLRRRGYAEAVADSAAFWAREVDDALKTEGERMLSSAATEVTLMVFDSTHHMIQLQRPMEVAEAMRDFLAGLR